MVNYILKTMIAINGIYLAITVNDREYESIPDLDDILIIIEDYFFNDDDADKESVNAILSYYASQDKPFKEWVKSYIAMYSARVTQLV